MQIVEVSGLGVRAAVITLGRANTPLKFVLFPMIHLAEPGFYEEVTKRLRTCDLIVAEGVGHTAGISALMLAYRLTARCGRTAGLVVQDIPLGTLGVPVVNPDMTGKDFRSAWTRLPLKLRLAIVALFPVVLVATLVVGTRRLIASRLQLDDLPSREELLHDSESMDKIDAIVVQQRDTLLANALSEIHDKHSQESIRVAVVYGAAHVPAVVRYLGHRYGYWPHQSEWVSVFEL